jgi:hypothetical protein
MFCENGDGARPSAGGSDLNEKSPRLRSEASTAWDFMGMRAEAHACRLTSSAFLTSGLFSKHCTVVAGPEKLKFPP